MVGLQDTMDGGFESHIYHEDAHRGELRTTASGAPKNEAVPEKGQDPVAARAMVQLSFGGHLFIYCTATFFSGLD